ncbi:TRAP transporter small permease [Megalodesulfovibrio gigas]|uniref:Putative tripartite ATP-independent periplasmic transporter DctQ component n=1 Tax=Megalodesulfovibrio gigas (strain ATCC 19364 / DSM 1382 / NCIMB 9332 / VKM B-1759) TaxID=1121448 RepID=T2GBV2_MEGG1|nr:TRAP transporter small permease [Megalodesulfovibrio gigas]AGW13586.1 putative tripartite ATP-independent periplasmic transporter DctQ component [Megalodesulfovibrio gigas DSM 1382 = ATCC 19364]
MSRTPRPAGLHAVGCRLDRAAHVGGVAAERLLGVLCIVIAAVLCLQALCRYVLNNSLPWPDELAQVLLVWLTFLGGVAAWRRGTHLGLAAATGWFTGRRTGSAGAGATQLVRAIPHLAGIFFFAVLLYHGLLLCDLLWPQRYPALGVTKVVSYAAIPVCAGLMLLHSLAAVLGAARLPAKVDAA